MTFLPSSLSGPAVSTSGQLLRLQADGEKRLHRVHVGRVGCLSVSQCARAASPGVETLLQVGTIVFLLLNTADKHNSYIATATFNNNNTDFLISCSPDFNKVL